MKTILMMAVSVLMFASTSFGQAMQSTEIVAQMDAQLQQDNLAVIKQAASYLPQQTLKGYRYGTLEKCTVNMILLTENDGLVVEINQNHLFGKNTSAGVKITPEDNVIGWGDNESPTVSETALSIGTKSIKSNGTIQKTLVSIIKNEDKDRAIIRIETGSKDDVDQFCNVKLK